MPSVGLSQTVSVRLNGAGNGQVAVGPLSAREVWQPSLAHVSVATNAVEAVCNIYVGDSPIQRNFRGATFTGSSGDSTDNVGGVNVRNPDKVWAVWTGGDPLAQATLTVQGTKDI